MPDAAAYTIIYRARGMTVVITPTLPREKKISESTELENIFSERRVGRAHLPLPFNRRLLKCAYTRDCEFDRKHSANRLSEILPY